MIVRRLSSVWLRASLAACSTLPAFVSTAQAYQVTDRWDWTATNGFTGAQGTPITLTWSIVPDGTAVPADIGGYTSSKLINFLDGLMGAGPGGSDYTQRPWFTYFDQSYKRLSEISGLTFAYEAKDDGIRHDGSASTNGLLGVRGDMRIGTSLYGEGSSVLASNYYPRYGGDMIINVDQGEYFGDPTNNYRIFRNIIMHEAMHGLGVPHVESEDADFLIEPVLNESFDGPQLDDILAIQRNYGDRWERGAGNNSAVTATSLGTFTGSPLTIGGLGGNSVVAATEKDFLSIDDDSDTDFFSFTITQRSNITLEATPVGLTYSAGPQGGTESPFNTLELNNLTLALIGANGSTVLTSSNLNGVGLAETISYQLDPGTYYARVRGTMNNIQLYGLTITGDNDSGGTLIWKGDAGNSWDVGVTANFVKEAAAAKFYSDMTVEFDDTAVNRNVELVQNVIPASVKVTTAETYRFSGLGGILSGSLTVDGTGVVELGNTNNRYLGPTTVESGTLKITGNANEMVSPIEVKAGAKLILDSVEAQSMASVITIREGGELQVGSEATTSNTLADVHPGIANAGTMRVFDAEEINHVTGNGSVILEKETSTISDNLGFDGPLVVKNGAAAKVLNAAAFGSNFGTTSVEDGGALSFDANITTGEPISVAGTGGGQGSLRVEAGRQVTLSGAVTVGGAATRIQLQDGAKLAINNGVNASAATAPLELATDAGSQLSIVDGLQAASGLVKSGAGNVIASGNIVLQQTVDVDAGKLTLAGPTPLGAHFDVAEGATLAISGAHTFTSSAKLTGKGLIQGTFNFPGEIAPGASAGGMAVEGNLALAGVLKIEIGGTTPMIDYDQLHIIGAGVLGGLAEVSLINNYVPSLGDSFTILTGTKPLSGQFGGLMLPLLRSDLGWNVSYLANSVRLSVASIGLSLPTDFNSDGFVNGSDLAVWRNNFGAANASRNQGDADGDGVISGNDFLLWQRQFSVGGSGVAAAAAVPEPATAWIALAAAVSLACGTRCRRR